MSDVMEDELDGQIVCATYTHARRHPMVLGNIGGWTPPFQVTLPQLGVIVVAYWVEVQTWRFWGVFLPPTLGILVGIALPCVLAWAVRRARVEGRSLPRAALGYVMLLSTPREGQARGRPYRGSRGPSRGHAPVFVAALAPEQRP